MDKIIDCLGGKVEVLEDELEGLTTEREGLTSELEIFWDGNKTLGWRGILGMNDYVEWGLVEIIDEVVLNKDEFTYFEGMVEGLRVAAIRASNSTDYWK